MLKTDMPVFAAKNFINKDAMNDKRKLVSVAIFLLTLCPFHYS